MPLSGGPATIHGILYQVLGSMRWACELALDAQLNLDEEEIDSAQLILEPTQNNVIKEFSALSEEDWSDSLMALFARNSLWCIRLRRADLR